MSNRLSLVLLLLAGLCMAGSSYAAVISPELQDALAAKSEGEFIRVLMFMDDYADLEPVGASLGKSALPKVRRDAVVGALKAHAADRHAPALAILEAAELGGQARDVRSLWLANAIVFKGTRQVIESLAATDIPATLVHDKPYDMISNVMGRRPEAHKNAGNDNLPPASPAQGDTAWSMIWINANRVWLDHHYSGSGVLVAHFDGGAWLTHPDLENRLYENPGEIPNNFIDDDGNGYVDDYHGWDFANQDSNPNDDVTGNGYNHGTHTAGTVCGDGTNGTITGVAKGASLLVCKCLLSDGSGAPFSAIYEAQEYATMMGARIFTMSLGIAGEIPASLMREQRYIGNALREAGVILFNSAGNDHYAFPPPNELGVTARVPAPWIAPTATVDPVPYSSMSGVVAVGGTGYLNNNIWGASSRGPADWGDVDPWNDWAFNPGLGLIKPDVAAPGQNVLSLQKPSGYIGNGWSGTSMACPHAAGLAALMLEKNPTLSPAGIDSIMEQTALDLGNPGKDNAFGSGRIDALAAFEAVPATEMPYLIQTDVFIDDESGDGIIDPGENFEVIFELTNNSTLVTATSVTGGLAEESTPFVSITDENGSFTDILPNGGTGTNSGDTFGMSAALGAPQGYVFTVYLHVAAQNGYQQTFDVDLRIGLPDYLDHNIGGVHLTVTDQGIIGYMNSAQTAGSGFGPIDGGSGLFVGSLWACTIYPYVCNRDYGNGDTAEWELVQDPNGRVRDLGAEGSDQTYRSQYSDSGYASPKSIVVTQNSYAWAEAPYDRFVIMEYTVRNDGATTVDNYHLGIFCDYDVGDYSTNEGDSDVGRKMCYLRNSDNNAFYGIALMGDSPLRNMTMINNADYVYDLGYIDDGFKVRFLTALITVPTTTAPDDWSCLTSAGPFTLAVGDSIKVALAMVYGESLEELQDNTDAANVVWSNPVAVEDLTPVKFNLGQNHPNPFNPATTIKFNVERAGQVQVAIYDLSGRKIRTLADENFDVGEHAVIWDGKNESGVQMPSGMYVYRYESAGQSQSRKMMLVK